MRSRLHPMRWPRGAWYAATLPWTAALAALAGGVYWAVRGEFWEPLWWGLAVGVPVQATRLWWYDRRRERGQSGAVGAGYAVRRRG